MTFAKEVNGH